MAESEETWSSPGGSQIWSKYVTRMQMMTSSLAKGSRSASGRRWTALLGGIGSLRVPNRILQWRGSNEPVFSQGPQNSQPIEIQDPSGRNIPSKWSV